MAGGVEVLSAGDISNQCTRGDQVRWCLVLQTSVDGRAEFVLDALRNVEPVVQLMRSRSWRILLCTYCTCDGTVQCVISVYMMSLIVTVYLLVDCCRDQTPRTATLSTVKMWRYLQAVLAV